MVIVKVLSSYLDRFKALAAQIVLVEEEEALYKEKGPSLGDSSDDIYKLESKKIGLYCRYQELLDNLMKEICACANINARAFAERLCNMEAVFFTLVEQLRGHQTVNEAGKEVTYWDVDKRQCPDISVWKYWD